MIPKVTDTSIDKTTSASADVTNQNAETTTQTQSPIIGRLGTKEVTQVVPSTTDQPRQSSSTEKAEATDASNSPKGLEVRTVAVVDPKADNDSKISETNASQVTGEKSAAPTACTSVFETEVDPKTAQKYLLTLYADHKNREIYDQFIKEHSFSSLEELLDRCIKDGFDINRKNKSGQTFLHVTAVWKDLDLMKALLSRKANPNTKTAFKNTPLHAASELRFTEVSASENLEIIKALVAAGADVNAQNYIHFTPFLYAAGSGNLDAIKLFLDKGADIEAAEKNFNLRALHIAANEGHIDAVQLLMKHGAQIHSRTAHGYTPLYMAAMQGHVITVQLLIQNQSNIHSIDLHGNSILHAAINRNYESVVDLLLEAHIDPSIQNNDGIRPLDLAGSLGHITIMEKLLNAGASIKFEEACRNITRRQVLHFASLKGHIKIIELLIQLGAEVDIIDYQNRTPLFIAASEGFISIAAFLIESGANINAVDIHGKSILCTAIEHKHEELVKLLVQKGADVNSVDNQGDTPLVHALSQGHAEISAFLIHNGAALHPVNP